MRPADHDQALNAARRWLAEYGRPAAWSEWELAQEGRPASRTIARRWGWHRLWIEAAATSQAELYPPGDAAKPGQAHLLQWSTEEMLAALRLAREAEGRWPAAKEWELAAETHPSRRTYLRRFGSWAAAIEAAGVLGSDMPGRSV